MLLLEPVESDLAPTAQQNEATAAWEQRAQQTHIRILTCESGAQPDSNYHHDRSHDVTKADA